jgi:hypothetical protein
MQNCSESTYSLFLSDILSSIVPKTPILAQGIRRWKSCSEILLGVESVDGFSVVAGDLLRVLLSKGVVMCRTALVIYRLVASLTSKQHSTITLEVG